MRAGNAAADHGDFGRLLRAVITRSVRYRAAAIPLALVIAAWGAWSALNLSLDVTPDLGSLQVQVLTPVPNLASEEIETAVTRPIELEMAGLPGLAEVRSLTRFGISRVSLVFADGTELYLARQLVAERLAGLREKLPRGLSPRLAPASAGLGEVMTYALTFRSDAGDPPGEAGLRQLKLTQDFVVRPGLRAVPGVAEVNTTGGYDQQMVVEVDPAKATRLGLDLTDIANVVERNAAVGGGALGGRDGDQLIVRSRARVQTAEALANLSIKLPWTERGEPLSSVATVGLGSGVRLGAATLNGQEAVLGTVLMLPGENARTLARALRAALAQARDRLPPGMELQVLYDRAELVDGVAGTVGRNLALAGLLVLTVLLLFLRSWRAGLIVTGLLALAFALCLGGMLTWGIVGSALTLGAIDFGVVADDAVVMVENVVRELAAESAAGRTIGRERRLELIVEACCRVRQPMLVGMLVIIGAYVPLLTLDGIEGRMFRPLAEAAILLLGSSLLLTLTLVPALCAVGLAGGRAIQEPAFLERWRAGYARLFHATRRRRWVLLALAGVAAVGAAGLATTLGANFLPVLDEGSLVVEVQRDPRVGLAQAVDRELRAERAIRAAVPEVANLFSRIGMSEVATDPQGPNQNDLYVSFRPRSQWRQVNGRTATQAELAQLIEAAIERESPGAELALNQPIAVRYDELLEDARTDLSIKVFGPDYDRLDSLATHVATVVGRLAGAGAIVVDRPGRIATLEFIPDSRQMLHYLASGDLINNAVSTALAGREVGRIDDGDRFYPLVVRIPAPSRADPQLLGALPVSVAEDTRVLGLGSLGEWRQGQSIGVIARAGGSRRETVMLTLDTADAVGFASRARAAIREQVPLPPGYRLDISGAYQSWQSGSARLLAAGGIFVLLSLALIHAVLGQARQTALVALGFPFALVGGIIALALRGLPLTLPAAVGFIILGGLSVLNGMVLITQFNDLVAQGADAASAALRSAQSRLRPVLMTALVAGVGFLPMVLSTGEGAELQRPLATVVIGGILTSTALTLLLLPLFLAGKARLGEPGIETGRPQRK